jgi:hypothetical protein
MKTLKAAFGVGLLILAGVLSGPMHVSRAQILVGGFTNQSDTLAPLSSVPASGTFWSAQLSMPPWPFDWLPQLPVYAYGPASNQFFVIDDRDFDYPSYWTSLAAATANSGGMGAMLVSGPPPLPGSGGTNSSGGGGGTSLPMPAFTTNDLYLTNFSVTKGTASLVIHPPSYLNATNRIWDIFYTTNLSPPVSWQWVVTNAPALTTLYVTNATNAQGFYTIGFPSAGTDFWVAFMSTVVSSGGTYGVWNLYISSPVTNTVMVAYPYLGWTTTNQFTAGMVTNISADGDLIYGYGSNAVDNYGIHITATLPVSVYGVCFGYDASWAFTAYPTLMLGTNYCLIARPSLDGSTNASQFAILATASNTTVHISPSTNANLPGYSGAFSTNMYTITLTNQGDTYQIKSSTWINDVTGTWITSTSPIVVFAGASDAYVPDTNFYGNALVQEQLPVASWGREVLALSFADRTNGDSYRVLAAFDDTIVTVATTNGVVTNNLQAGRFFDTNLDGWVEFQANNPIQVAQFATGALFESTNDNMEGDPCYILLPPTGHYLTSYTIPILPNDGSYGDFNTNFLNLIVPQSAITNTFVNGSSITNYVAITNFVAITNSGYWAAHVPVPAGTNYTVSSSQPFEVEVYGFGICDAYGYIGGVITFP